ncbi:aminotransferase-like domain-containing protein [Alkaliphilus hydrothermalis]|uniref:DNA-binding transcriptional MocR family regulator n=1 Tax=Alkaliphilus hydrothermalis TaxID=1482730 RepID=A0ABS2NPJ3_9FIRM|nr:PLP-dependent aminotransferase family protein [Alkaliphilus hydrothermalis]MBM7614863.1 DNA-binding transcriptional MocR family regulator [Alkaliphilus hydrothermalis]
MNKTDIVKNYISNEIKVGRIKKGQRLPSCREMAAQLSINKITVNKAYNELEKEHKVYSIPRGGFYLVDSEESTKIALKEVDFQSVKPDEKLIPYREFTHAMNKAIDMYKNSLFGYEATGGLASLKETLKIEFEKDGVYTSTENLVITHGAQQAIVLILQTVFKKEKGKLLVEAPTYSLVLKLAEHMGIDVIGIERKKDGFNYKEMEKIFSSGEIRAFYVIPRHHNPTGYSLKEKEKRRIAELSSMYNVLIIEDDYLADIGSKKSCMPIHYYDVSKCTVYIRSFSKTFMPGIRMGAVVVPEVMVGDVLSLKHLSDLNTSKIPQSALNSFIKSGMYEKHIKKVKKSYENKLKRAAEMFNALSPSAISWHVPSHGIFIWIELPNSIDMLVLENKLKGHGILIKNATEFFPQKYTKENYRSDVSCIRLCISGVLDEQIESLTTLIKILRGLLENNVYKK